MCAARMVGKREVTSSKLSKTGEYFLMLSSRPTDAVEQRANQLLLAMVTRRVSGCRCAGLRRLHLSLEREAPEHGQGGRGAAGTRHPISNPCMTNYRGRSWTVGPGCSGICSAYHSRSCRDGIALPANRHQIRENVDRLRDINESKSVLELGRANPDINYLLQLDLELSYLRDVLASIEVQR